MHSHIAPPIPPAFLERMRRLLGDEYPAFAAALEQAPVSGLRVNTLKISAEEFQKIAPFSLEAKVPWCDSAFILHSAAFQPGLHPYHLAGLYYIQDPSAMAPAELLAPKEGECVLDLAAAPGGKTTHLASLMQGRGLLVANEIKEKRVGHLAVNVERWGAGNIVVTNESPERLADHFGAFFDRVLVDAPCSGEGMFRKDMGARLDWSPEMIAGCAARQSNILRVAARLVRPGGYLLYSTCTFAPEENEAMVNGLCHGFTDKNGFQEFEVVELPLLEGFERGRPEWIQDADPGLRGAVRLFPHRLRGEGHFVCLLRRSCVGSSRDSQTEARPRAKTNWKSERLVEPSDTQRKRWQEFAEEMMRVDFPADRLRVRGERLYLLPEPFPDFGALRLVHPGVWLGTFKKDRFEPAHPLALFLRKGQAKKTLDLHADGGEVAAYLRGEPLASEGPSGWVLITVNGWPLGWGKRVQGLVKNHYPRGWMAPA